MRHVTLDILPRERKFNQDYFLAFIAPELVNENARVKRRLDSRQNPTMFSPKKMTRVPHPVCSPGLPACEFWLFGSAKE
jgi:hypothetical protein